MNCNSARQKTDCFSWMKLMNQSYFKKMSLRSANSQIKSLKIKKHPRFVQLLLPNIGSPYVDWTSVEIELKKQGILSF